MRTLSLQESLFISGGEDIHSFSNAFISGMKGEACDFTFQTLYCGALGFFAVGGACLSAGPEAALIGAVFGLSFGALIGLGVAYDSYFHGRNYMQAQQLLTKA